MRKVMGAGVPGLVLLLSREFLLLVGLAAALAMPTAWFLNDLWLRHFAMRVVFGAAVVIPALLVLTVLALVTIGSQTMRAALVNPVDTLRQE